MNIKCLKITSVALVGVFAFTNCDRNEPMPNTPQSGNYLITLHPEGSFDNTLHHVVDDFAEGKELNITDAVEAPDSYILTQLSGYGYVYVHQRKSSKLIKYKSENGKLVEKAQMVTPNFGDLSFMSSISWIVPGKTFFTSNALYNTFLQGAIINVETMSFEKNIDIPVSVASDRSLFPGFSFLKDGMIFFSYINVDNNTYAADSMRFVLLDQNTLEIKKYISDGRSVSPGITFMNCSFTDEAGDLYFVTTPSNYWALRPELPSAIYRIKKSEQIIDPSYEMNLSNLCGNGRHACGNIYYNGNGQIVFRMFDESLIKEYSDYEGYNQNGVFPVEVWTGNVVGKSVAKINVPNGRLSTQDFIRTHRNKIVFPLNSSEGSFVYQFSSDLNAAEKVVTYRGASRIRELYKF